MRPGGGSDSLDAAARSARMSDLEMHDPESLFEPKRYRQWFRCPECGHRYASKWAKAPPKKDVPCPRRACVGERELRQAKLENQRLLQMLEERKAPAQIGASNMVKAVDFTAEATMKSYGMTDLKDNIREGESMAPKLPGAAQAAADTYFASGKTQQSTRMVDLVTGRQRSVQAKHLNMIAERAVKGAYRRRAVSPIEVIPKDVRNQSPLAMVRETRNPHFKGS